jgi:molecular chaperone DnaK (HSP70)
MSSISKWSIGIASSKGDFVCIIPKDSNIPARRSIIVTTSEDSQPDMNLLVYMGQEGRAEDNYLLSSIRLECKEKAPAGTPRIKLTFYVYDHSIIKIGVRYKERGPEQELSIIPASDLSDEDMKRLNAMIKRMIAESITQPVGDELGPVALPPV